MKKLHVGSGPHYAEGWVNLDLNNWHEWEKQPDVLGSVFDMHMFKDGEFDRLYCGHLLEHLELFKTPEALAEMSRVVKDGGLLCFVGPCMDKARATKQPQWLLDEIPRGWDKPDDPEGFPHLWTATTELTRIVLETTFDKDRIVEVSITEIKLPEWPNTAPGIPPMSGMWQCAFIVTK